MTPKKEGKAKIQEEDVVAGESWYAVFKTDTGELVSTGTEVADESELTAQGMKAIVIEKKPDETVVWDKTVKNFVPAPDVPQPLVADLVIQQEGLRKLDDDHKQRIRKAVAGVVGETV